MDSVPSPPVLDVEGTLARLGGDHDLFAELAGLLLDDLPALFNDLRAAVAAENAPKVRNTSHALRGLVAGCGGIRAEQVAQAIENAGHTGDLDQAASLVKSLETELELLTRALQPYRQP